MRRALLSLLLSLSGCSCGPSVLDDRDAGSDAAASDVPSPDDVPRGDAGPDAGTCLNASPTPPTDPLAGDWVERFANPGVGGSLPIVEAFAFEGDDVYVGGTFTTGGYAPARNVARWDAALGWSALGDGLPGRVKVLATAPDGSIYAAHAASESEFDPTRISRWDGTAWTELTRSEGAIQSIAFVGSTLYAVGGFTRIGGVDARVVARFDGTAWSGFAGLAPEEGATVEAISATGPDDVCIGGTFTTLGVIEAQHVACWDGAAWTARSTPVPFYRGVFTLARDPSDGALVAGGDFRIDTGDVNGGSIARWETDHWALIGGGVLDALGPGTTKMVRSIVFVGSDLYVAGGFELVDGTDPQPAHGIARWDGTAWHDLGGVFPEVGIFLPTDNVWGMAAGPDGSVFLGGAFTRAGSLRVSHVVRWDGAYFTALQTPAERYEGVSGSIEALEREGTCAIYVGGGFEYAGAVRVNNVARYTDEGGFEALGDGLPGAVADLAFSEDGFLVAGGDFIDDAVTFRNVAVWDGVRWTGVGDGLSGGVFAVDTDRPQPDEAVVIYAGGQLTAAGSTSLHNVARWDGTSWQDLGAGITGYPLEFDPTMQSEPQVYDVLVDPVTHDLVVAGSFQRIGEGADAVVANNIARWDGTRWHAYGAGIGGLFQSVLAITWAEGDLVAVGSFDVDGSTMPAARWDGTAWVALGAGGFDSIQLGAVEAVGDTVFVGGIIEADGESTHLAHWSGTAWTPIRGGMSDLVSSLLSTEEGLYVAGPFDRAGSAPSVGLALYTYED